MGLGRVSLIVDYGTYCVIEAATPVIGVRSVPTAALSQSGVLCIAGERNVQHRH